jgi:uncharacterized delta-60 repeat protein
MPIAFSAARIATIRRLAARGCVLLALTTITPPVHALDPGEPGTVLVFAASGSADGALAGTIDPDGSLVMAGYGASEGYSVLARMASNDSADSTFGTNGLIVYDFNNHLNDELRAIVRMNDGRYAACGRTTGTDSGVDFLAARFTSNGALDPSFNLSGFADTTFLASGVAGLLPDVCNAVAVQSDGKIVTAGYTQQNGFEHVALIRYATDGMLDGMFGSGGKVDINASFGVNGDSSAQALLIQPDGKLLIAGNASGPSNSDFLVMRLNTNGTPDTNFGDHGITRTSIGGNDIANAMVLQPDGRIVIAGQSDGDFALARYTSAGVLDTTFGTMGKVKTPIGPGADVINGLALMPWGRIVAVGTARIDASAQGNEIAVAAYNADGSLDKYFGNGGKVMKRATGVTKLTPPDEILYGIAVDIDRAHFWTFGYGVEYNDRDFIVVEFGLPDTIFRDDYEAAPP